VSDDIQLGKNIFQLRRRPCRSGTDGYKYAHGPFIVDEELATVECGTCRAQLDPIQILTAYARKEARIADRFTRLEQSIEKISFKAERQNRVRCEHCQKLTRIKKEGV